MENRFLTEEPQTQYQAPPVTPQALTTQEESEQQQEQVVTEFVAKMKKRALRYRNSVLLALTSMLLILGLSLAYLTTHHGSRAGSVMLLLSLGGGLLYTLGSTLLAA